ncbi:MAG TPA: response regulator transcription factor [Actinomycetota bacterium]|nr:response regulator transcription factor [Actinomycetota bacterium]
MTAAPQVSPRMMIVDDEPLIRQVLRRLLERQGATVCAEAADGREAVRVAALAKPDIILMDLRMPGLDGLQATKQIIALLPGVSVIMTTAYTDQAFRDEAEAAGVTAYVVKGTRPSVLKEAIDAAWSEQQARLSAA